MNQDRPQNLLPVKKPPCLFRFNGMGFTVFGKRDYDEATNTYVITHYGCFLFIPIFALGAYRVADAQGQNGWHFFGKVPLSTTALIWNLVSLTIIIAALIAVLRM